MTRGVFVTGSDTDCGKTFVARAMLHQLGAQGVRAAGFKPVAAGAAWRDGELRNDDALALQSASGPDLPYALVNPYCFEPAIAPHLAAAEAGVEIDLGVILAARAGLAQQCDFIVAEGAGGWLVPLGPHLDIEGLAVALELPVLLVVGLRLGCLNHALLSARAVRASGARLAGWVASQVDPHMQRAEANVASLVERLGAPCLGVLPRPGSDERLAGRLPLALDGLMQAR